jgi:hypothetical protein
MVISFSPPRFTGRTRTRFIETVILPTCGGELCSVCATVTFCEAVEMKGKLTRIGMIRARTIAGYCAAATVMQRRSKRILLRMRIDSSSFQSFSPPPAADR